MDSLYIIGDILERVPIFGATGKFPARGIGHVPARPANPITAAMLDKHGYRPNVGIILLNQNNQVFWGKRIREQSWQFPQGGIKAAESPQQAMYRELQEEIGLTPQTVTVLGRTHDWLHYDVPVRWVRREWRGHYRGQKQIWFLLRLLADESAISLDGQGHPEFDAWRWTDYWAPLTEVIEFKRSVYDRALRELAVLLGDGVATAPEQCPSS